MKHELERVRDWAKGKIRTGSDPNSWEKHVKLIEAADALLHDMSVSANSDELAQSSDTHPQNQNQVGAQFH